VKSLLLLAILPSLAMAGGGHNSGGDQNQNQNQGQAQGQAQGQLSYQELIIDLRNDLKVNQGNHQNVTFEDSREFVGAFAPADTCGLSGGYISENNHRQGGSALFGCTWSIGAGSREKDAQAALAEWKLHEAEVDAKREEIMFNNEMKLHRLRVKNIKAQNRLISDQRRKLVVEEK
jgi:hypothetical protein